MADRDYPNKKSGNILLDLLNSKTNTKERAEAQRKADMLKKKQDQAKKGPLR